MKRVFGLLVAAGCGASAPPEPAPGCNPLIGDDCLTPFPSAFFERPDATTATGVRLAIAESAMPVPHGGKPISADPFSIHDGVSPSTPFVVYFKAGVDATMLPSADASLLPTSPVQIVDVATGQRVPVFAELDGNAQPGDRQALLIRPMVRLAPATRYAIALVGLRDAAGNALEPAPFAALRDGKPLSHALAGLHDHYEELFATLETAGIARRQLTLAWDVVTASEHDLTGHLVTMRDQALPMVDGLHWTVDSATDTPADPHLLRVIAGTFEVPSFLSDDSLTPTLLTDASGAPRMRDTLGVANFEITIPRCAETRTGPLPVIVFGHGLFSSAHGELATSYQKQLGDYLCAVQIATDWIGLAEQDFPTLANVVLPDFNQLHVVTDRLQQAHVNAQVLARLFLKRLKDDPALRVGGTAVTDGANAYYYGISDGGIQGGTFMALSQDVHRGVLNVPGCEWSTMMFRSFEFDDFLQLFQILMPDPLDQELVLAMLQSELDTTDPASFAPHLIHDPLPNTPAKQILVQEALGDAQVPNIATRVLVRTIGLAGLDLVEPVFGVTEQASPLASAYTQWDVTATPLPPAANIPAPMDNGAHEAVRRLVPLESQLRAFFAPDGNVIQTCSGPCVCDLSAGTCAMPAGVWPPD